MRRTQLNLSQYVLKIKQKLTTIHFWVNYAFNSCVNQSKGMWKVRHTKQTQTTSVTERIKRYDVMQLGCHSNWYLLKISSCRFQPTERKRERQWETLCKTPQWISSTWNALHMRCLFLNLLSCAAAPWMLMH